MCKERMKLNIFLDWNPPILRDLRLYTPDFLFPIELTPRANRSRTVPRLLFPLVFADVASSASPDCLGATGLATSACFHRLFRSPPRLRKQTGSGIEPPRLRGGTRTAGSLLSFNILASPLAAAARSIDMRPGFRISFRLRSASLHAARHRDTTRYDTTRHGTTRHGSLSHASLHQTGQTFSSGANLTNALHAPFDIDMGMRRIDPRRARSAYLFGHRSRGYRTATAAAYGSESVTFRLIRERTSLYKPVDRYRIVKLGFSSRCLYSRTVVNRQKYNQNLNN